MYRSALLCLSLGISLVSACKDKAPKERAVTAMAAKDFWPEAPAPTKGTAARTLAYKPESITGYTMVAKGGSPGDAKLRIDYDMTLALLFKDGATPRERNTYIQMLDMKMEAATERMKMRLDHDGMTVTSGTDAPVTLKRGDDGPLDVAGMVDKPFTTLVFTDANAVELRTIASHPFNELGGTGDMLDTALVLFPDLPQGPVAPGHTWTVTHDTPVGTTNTKVAVTYNFEYAGDSACPSGKPSCAQLHFTASSKNTEVQSEGNTVKLSYGFAGKVFFDTERGAVDESRVRMDMDASVKGINMLIGGTFVIKPS